MPNTHGTSASPLSLFPQMILQNFDFESKAESPTNAPNFFSWSSVVDVWLHSLHFSLSFVC